MAAVAQPSCCEVCAVMSWKSEERQLETPSRWRFTDCLHFIVWWSPVSPVCFTCPASSFFLYHFFSTMLMFPRWPEYHHSTSLVAWIRIRQWHTALVNVFCYQEPFRRLKKRSWIHWHTVELLWLVDIQCTGYFIYFFTLWTVCLDFSMFLPFFWLFPYTLPRRGCDCSIAEGQQFWHLQPSEGILNTICGPPGAWFSNPPCLGLESQTTKPHLGLIWSSESLTLVHTLIPKVQHIPTYCCTKQVYRQEHPQCMDMMIYCLSFTIICHYMNTDKVAK